MKKGGNKNDYVQEEKSFITRGKKCLICKKIYLADIEFDNGGTVEVVELQEDWHFQILTSV